MCCVFPKLVIKLNDKVVMPNKWDSDGFGASKYSIQPPCKPRDGSNGRDDSTYDGREIDYNYPSGAKDTAHAPSQSNLPCRSPDFDTGDSLFGMTARINCTRRWRAL